jgi:ribosomal protein S18 acetylase RimI-like enzyme
VAPDEQPLDNPVHASLTTAHAHLAERRGRVVRYPPEVSPFFAVPSPPAAEDWRDAAELIAAGSGGVVEDAGTPPATWTRLAGYECLQMVGPGPEPVRAATSPAGAPLTAADVPEMLELVRRTEPGPFMARTIELGSYLGIRDRGALVAMAGERMHLTGWTEISAVCTAPSHRGQGLAARLIMALMAGIAARAERPFLHVMTTNAPAIRVYEKLGFAVRRELTIAAVTPGPVAAATPLH